MFLKFLFDTPLGISCFVPEGFGLTDTNDITIDALPDTLLEVDIKYVPEETCRDVYKWILDSSMMCAIDKDKDACR